MDAAEARAHARRGYELLSAEGVDAMRREVWHDDVVLDEGDAFPNPVRAEGIDAVAERFRERATFAGRARMRMTDAEPAAEDRILARVVVEFETDGPGQRLPFPWWQVLTVRDGRTVEILEFADEAKARRAAGLEP